MMRLGSITVAFSLICLAGASAQDQPPTNPPKTDAAMPAAPASATPPSTAKISKREACQADGSAKGLRGMDKVDAMQICMAEARLDCVKQAVAQKIPREKRRDYEKSCVGASE